MKFFPSTRRADRGFTAGVHDDRQQRYIIIPLGDERSKEFYSEAAAEQLSERYAEMLNRAGSVEGFKHLRLDPGGLRASG